MPGMYVVTSIPLVSRTRATLRSAEFGFFGVVVYTRTQTPRRCGQAISAGDAVLRRWAFRPNLTSWLMVGMEREKPRVFCCEGAATAQTAGARRRDYREGQSLVNGPFAPGRSRGPLTRPFAHFRCRLGAP